MPIPVPVSLDPVVDPTVKFIRGTLRSRKAAEQLEALIRETLFRSVRDELLSGPRYSFTDKDARRDEDRIRRAVRPIAAAALRCAVDDAANGRRWFPGAVLRRLRRQPDDLATLSSFSVRDKLREWLTDGSREVFAQGREADQATAPPRSVAKSQPPWGPWWAALAEPSRPVVTRAIDMFEDVVRDAGDDPDGSDESRKFAQRLDDALAKNDLRRERERQTRRTAVGGAAATGILAAVELIEPAHQLLPATAAVGGVSLVLALWLASRARDAPTAAEASELEIAVDGIRDWLLNVEQLPEGNEKHLIGVLQQRLLPSIESFRVSLLQAELRRVGALLDDRAACQPSYQQAKLDVALRELHRLVDPQTAEAGRQPRAPQPGEPADKTTGGR